MTCSGRDVEESRPCPVRPSPPAYREGDGTTADASQTDRRFNMPGASQEQNEEALLEVLKTISHGVSVTGGDRCQVVIHDLEDLERLTVLIACSCPQAGTP